MLSPPDPGERVVSVPDGDVVHGVRALALFTERDAHGLARPHLENEPGAVTRRADPFVCVLVLRRDQGVFCG